MEKRALSVEGKRLGCLFVEFFSCFDLSKKFKILIRKSLFSYFINLRVKPELNIQ